LALKRPYEKVLSRYGRSRGLEHNAGAVSRDFALAFLGRPERVGGEDQLGSPIEAARRERVVHSELKSKRFVINVAALGNPTSSDEKARFYEARKRTDT
jgi:hypothetical protein